MFLDTAFFADQTHCLEPARLQAAGRIAVLGLGLAVLLACQSAQAQPQPGASAPIRPASARTERTPAKPVWADLSAPQKQALAPLASQWETLSEAHKRKWLAMAANFPKMPAAEQTKMHSRMAEWLALSPSQRTEARLNFGETQQLSADEKKAKWEAYQALPPEEKRKLAASAVAKPPATAAAIRPVPAEKMASVPRSVGAETKPARIVLAAPSDASAGSAPASSTPAQPGTNR